MPPYQSNAVFYTFGSHTPSPSLKAASDCGLSTVPQLAALAADRAVRRISPGAPARELLADTTLIGALLAPEMPHSLACHLAAARLLTGIHRRETERFVASSFAERYFLALHTIARALHEKQRFARGPYMHLGQVVEELATPRMNGFQIELARQIPADRYKDAPILSPRYDYTFPPAPHKQCGAPGTLGELLGMPVTVPNEAKKELMARGMSLADMIASAEEHGVVRNPGNWSADDPRRCGFLPRKLVCALLSLDNPADKRCITAAAEVMPRVPWADVDDLLDAAAADRSFWLMYHLASTGARQGKDERWHRISCLIGELTKKTGTPAEITAWLPDVTRPMSHVSVASPEI